MLRHPGFPATTSRRDQILGAILSSYRLPRRVVRRLAGMGSTGRRIGRTVIGRLWRQSDYRRWSGAENLESWWETRTVQLASFVPPGRRLIEFGAGRRQLEKYLPPGCDYVPSDLVDRGPGTLLCDLNRRPLPDLRGLDVEVAFFAGVLEYVSDLRSLIRWLSTQVEYCILSYDGIDTGRGRVNRLIEALRRAQFGYQSHYTEGELVGLFTSCGFSLEKQDIWCAQRLFLFRREPEDRQDSP